MFLFIDFWYPADISASINIPFNGLPYLLCVISKDSALVCLSYPVLCISVILAPSTALSKEYVFIKYLY